MVEVVGGGVGDLKGIRKRQRDVLDGGPVLHHGLDGARRGGERGAADDEGAEGAEDAYGDSDGEDYRVTF